MGLIPFADMLNHSYDRKQTNYSFDEERNGFKFEALQDIPKNLEITTSYGSKCNSRYFMSYGFVNLNNCYNQVPLLSYLNSDDHLYKYKV